MLWVLSIGERDRVQVQLHLEDGCASVLDMMERWIKALKTMVQVLCITQQELRAKRPPAVGGVRKAIWYLMLLATGKMTEREQEVAQFVRFAEASILRMLDFVDAVADAALNDDQAPEMLPGMLLVYTCVVDDSPAVLALFEEASMASSMFDAMNSVFLRKMNRLSDAIWSMMEKVRTSFATDDCWRVSSAEVGGVHRTTRLMMSYIMLLSHPITTRARLISSSRIFLEFKGGPQPLYCKDQTVKLVTIFKVQKKSNRNSKGLNRQTTAQNTRTTTNIITSPRLPQHSQH